MSKQLHKNFTDQQVKSLLESYLKNKIKINYILQILRIKRRRFFELLSKYQEDPDNFSIQYKRNTSNYRINPKIEANIIHELKIEKDLIKNKEIPIRYYDYSYIKDLLEQKYKQKVSLPTIIDRAKRNSFYFLKPERKAHEQEILTNYIGELIQYDSSHHQFSPYAKGKWYLITSLDDFSRFLFYAILVEKNPSQEYILTLEYYYIIILHLFKKPLFFENNFKCIVILINFIFP